MSAFDHSVLTDAGWDQLSAALAGGKLTFVHMEAGDGTVTGDAEMQTMTALKHKIMDIPITSYSNDGQGQITLVGVLSSRNVNTAFSFRELGVKATIDAGSEALYCVANAYDNADFIPDKNNAAVVIQNIEIVVKIDRATDIVVNLSVGANVTAQNIGLGTVGAGWFRDKIGNILNFKRFASTGSVKVTETLDVISADVVFPQFVPTGCMLDYPGLLAPGGWLICDGSAISRSSYSALFAVLGTRFGGGDGSTTFNLPDVRGRVTLGAGTGAGLSGRNVGDIGGSETTVLTVDQLPAHSHTATQPAHVHGVNDPGHSHAVYDPTHAHSVYDGQHSHSINNHAHSISDPGHHHTWYSVYYNGSGGQYATGASYIEGVARNTTDNSTGIGIYGSGTLISNASGANISIYGAATGISIYAAATGVYLAWAGNDPITVYNTGSGASHNNMQPFLVINKIIKI